MSALETGVYPVLVSFVFCPSLVIGEFQAGPHKARACITLCLMSLISAEGSLTHNHKQWHHPFKLVGIQQWKDLALISWTKFNLILHHSSMLENYDSNQCPLLVLICDWRCTRAPSSILQFRGKSSHFGLKRIKLRFRLSKWLAEGHTRKGVVETGSQRGRCAHNSKSFSFAMFLPTAPLPTSTVDSYF